MLNLKTHVLQMPAKFVWNIHEAEWLIDEEKIKLMTTPSKTDQRHTIKATQFTNQLHFFLVDWILSELWQVKTHSVITHSFIIIYLLQSFHPVSPPNYWKLISKMSSPCFPLLSGLDYKTAGKRGCYLL